MVKELIVEYLGNRLDSKKDSYDIYYKDENGSTHYICGGFDRDQVNIATFAINNFILVEENLTKIFNVNDTVEIRGNSGTWYDGKIIEVKEIAFNSFSYIVLVKDENEEETIEINNLNNIRLKEK